ncbi:MAG: DsbA family protein [Saprospiraceae bacterium]|nr:DsbA family protein [Saprospiraceae bacterium]
MSELSFSQQDTLIYIGDPMCSWCYGFGPELAKIKAAFPETPFEMVMGGLRAGGTETMVDLKDFLKDHWQEVQEATGQPFNYAMLNQHEVVYDTEPSCRAVMVAGRLKPEIKYAYFKAVQESFYFHNTLPNDDDTFVQLAVKFGIDGETFHKLFKKQQSKLDVFSEFELAQKLGVQGFPSLIAKIDGKLYMVTNGYQKAERIIKLLENRGLH